MLLEKINKENDIRKIPRADYPALAAEIREFLIDRIAECGGHLASNLGVVELTIALHSVLRFPNDKLVWDVGHQAYTHKILTGRKDEFGKLRAYGGLSGFPKRRESNCDAFDTGHSSTSISAGLGIVEGYALSGNNGTVVSVIGDGALTGGMAYEALNNASHIKRNFIIVLNDNEMSISKNVGGMSAYLSGLRAGEGYIGLKEEVKNSLSNIPVVGDKIINQVKKTKNSIKQLFIPGMLFENMGITYLGPVDGHDINQMIRIFKEAKSIDHAVLVHVVTKKGKGYSFAEKYPSRFHGTEPFDKLTGKVLEPKTKPTYTDVFAKKLVKEAETKKNIVAISAAMASGTGLDYFQKFYPDRFFDVGIAEEHAVTFAAGLAASGYRPYVAIYSSFLQRAYDQILHDVCIQDLPVVFMLDRAGLVGGDGETHQGIFDLSYLTSIPNMSVMAPKNKSEFEKMIEYSTYASGPVAIRYPRGAAWDKLEEFDAPIEYGKAEIIHKEKDILIVAIGTMVSVAMQVKEKIKEAGGNVTVVNARFAKPFDEKLLMELTANHYLVVTMEENVLNGGFGEQVTRFLSNTGFDGEFVNAAIPNVYIEHGKIDEIRHEAGLDAENIFARIKPYI